MRRVIFSVFFCLAACGGTDMVKQSSPGPTPAPNDRASS